MSDPETAHFVTANDLLTGEVVFLAADDRWVVDLATAELLADADEAAERLRRVATAGGPVVGPYLALARRHGPEAAPAQARERIRATGPSNYVHGKQERAAHV